MSGATTATAAPGASAPGRRPNVLLILTDQHRADHTGFGGNPIVQTPNLDALARTGMRFDRAFVSNPVCMPNRGTIMTGRVPSAHGTRFNGISLDLAANTFVDELRLAGYRTGLIGKSHLQNIGDHPAVVPTIFPSGQHAGVRNPWPPGWDRLENEDRHRDEDVEITEPFYGFEHCEFVVNHADYASGHYYRWLLRNGVDNPLELTGSAHSPEVAPEWWQIYKPALPAELYPTSYIADRTVALVEQWRDEPWMIQCSFPDPHHPFTPPGHYWDMYDPADVALPETFDVDPSHLMPHLQRWRRERGTQRGRMSPWSPTEQQFRVGAAKEYGAITMIDDAVGRVLQALERTGQRDNTIVIFTADHADMFGEQGIWLKGVMHYLGCTRVPFVWNGPGVVPGVNGELVGSIDISSTVLDLCGTAPYAGMQGHSLRAMLGGDAAPVRKAAYIEEDMMFDLVQRGTRSRVRTIITKDARLTAYHGIEGGELYDLSSDPHEAENRWGSDRSASAALLEGLVQLTMDHADEARVPAFMA